MTEEERQREEELTIRCLNFLTGVEPTLDALACCYGCEEQDPVRPGERRKVEATGLSVGDRVLLPSGQRLPSDDEVLAFLDRIIGTESGSADRGYGGTFGAPEDAALAELNRLTGLSE